ncbi:histone deacetylase family protein [Phyllobacterium sp. 0TCS1.6C]|uniref:histone deacetylase family protein n=1 Tax=unclassified Phyllobacterium TaxID=2638441 RepID=UPI002265241C|nr:MULTISPECIES: histone deacetylase family protein [unclassified Phyllobacterium]MCX8278699.1 histone deacetylase family protein [Phyllobacterium sp. 0TCS1.6C]MCX8293471.1 histone deacetylase family protein [Phyllobacterium sp. 0TCS1.6A]
MKLFFDSRQMAHRPTQYMINGVITDPLENPTRAETLIKALAALGLEQEKPADAGLAAIHAVHPEHYVSFLSTAYERFMELPNHGPEVLPNVSAYQGAAPDYGPRPLPRPSGILGQAGWYINGLSCAMMEQTYDAAYASAQTAIAAGNELLNGASDVFALCRPPGHHAYADRAAGFCYFNNAAIVAQQLRGKYDRVAIIDFDTHHGDGTQAIFYTRDDVFFGSTHTDPSNYYPHFSGYADETGAGKGEGANLNLPLAEGSGDEAFIEANRKLAAAVAAHGAQALVISAGWDAHHQDPLSKLAVTTGAYAEIGAIWGGVRLPTAIVQEGGYSLSAVAEAAPRFIAAYRNRRQMI